MFSAAETAGEIRKVLSHRVQPDRAARQEAAGARGIGVFQHALELVVRGAARQQDPGNAMLVADLADGVEFLLRGLCRGAAVAGRQTVGRKRALQLQKIDAIFGLGEFAHALDHQRRQLARRFDIVRGVIGAAEEGIDQKFEHIGNVVARALLADLAHELLLMRVDGGIGVRPIPRQHLDGVTAHGADFRHAPVVDHARLAAAGRFLDTMLLQRHDQPAMRRQQIDRGRHGEIRIEQHRAAMRRQRLDQQPLGRGDVGIGDLIPG